VNFLLRKSVDSLSLTPYDAGLFIADWAFLVHLIDSGLVTLFPCVLLPIEYYCAPIRLGFFQL